MSTTDKETMVQKIAKLLNMAEGAKAINNQHEAEAFAAKAQELMFRYKIEASDVELRQQAEENPLAHEWVDFSVHGVKPRAGAMQWQVIIGMAVARSNFCEVLFADWSNNMQFIGRRLDRQVAIYVTHVLLRTGERMVKQEYRRQKRIYGGPGDWSKGFNSSFLMGYATALKARLDRDRAAMTQQLSAQQRGVAVVRLRTAREELDGYITEKIKLSDKKLETTKPRHMNPDAYMNGIIHGTNVPMPNRGVSDGEGKTQLPKST